MKRRIEERMERWGKKTAGREKQRKERQKEGKMWRKDSLWVWVAERLDGGEQVPRNVPETLPPSHHTEVHCVRLSMAICHLWEGAWVLRWKGLLFQWLWPQAWGFLSTSRASGEWFHWSCALYFAHTTAEKFPSASMAHNALTAEAPSSVWTLSLNRLQPHQPSLFT